MLGLPDGIHALLFDLDGVLTDTASVHRVAWGETFDAFLRERDGDGFRPFSDADYREHVDGLPRLDGVRGFLRSRAIELPEGEDDDPVDAQTVNGLGNRKNARLKERIEAGDVRAYEGSRRYLRAAVDAGLRRAVVSSSANARDVLAATGLLELVEEVVDAHVRVERGLKGKPAPDTFLHGAELLGATPGQAAVFEDALSGVQAGRDGAFAAVVGVDRTDEADALREHGATQVVADLDELLGAEA